MNAENYLVKQFSFLHKDLSQEEISGHCYLIFFKLKTRISYWTWVKGSTVKGTSLLWTFSFPLPQSPQSPWISASQTLPSVGIT